MSRHEHLKQASQLSLGHLYVWIDLIVDKDTGYFDSFL